jgi:hypothetical protein
MKEIDLFANFVFSDQEKIDFATNELWKTWVEKYPFLFDHDDLIAVAENPAFHYYEWMAAIRLYEEWGYLSLVEKYVHKRYARKYGILCQLAPKKVVDMLTSTWKNYHTHCPDLLVYRQDQSEYFFCEVKGQHERITQNQDFLFDMLRQVSNKRTCIIRAIPKLK